MSVSRSFDFERNDYVAAKCELRTLRASPERRGVVQRGIIANLWPDNRSFKHWVRHWRLDVEAQCECAISGRSATERNRSRVPVLEFDKIEIAGERSHEEAIVVAPNLAASNDLEPVVDRVGKILRHASAG